MFFCFSFISGITLLGTPTEMYLHGTEYMLVMVPLVLSGYISSEMIIPVFHELQLPSTYEVKIDTGIYKLFKE